MALESGTRLGHYEISDQIGQGGMGEVYRATDTRLDRTVAIKVLPEHLGSDPSRRERFEREAKAVSSLNHPHICTLYDVGEQDGTHYLVMELVEGETLEARLEKGRLPLNQALEYAIQIADALDRSHRQGVVHRDLKPGNVMLTKSGVKLLDFGLAKLKGDASPTSGLSQAPTQDKSLTAEGTILGTLQYMAPEQLEGEEADSRTDIFAFGAVVYEMVTGKKAFEGKSQASLISSIMSGEPQAMTELQDMTPLSLDRVVRKCLAKDRDDRWQTARDLLDEVRWIAASGREVQHATSVGAPRITTGWVAAGLALALVTIVLAALGGSYAERRRLSEGIPAWADGSIQESFGPPEGSIFDASTDQPFAVSPDGRAIAFVAIGSDGVRRLWLRPVASDRSRMLPDTEGARSPFWSPDSEWIAFYTPGALRRIRTSDLESDVVTGINSGRYLAPSAGAWGGNGTILFKSGALESLLERISLRGGESTFIASLPGTRTQRHPFFLDGGDEFIYGAFGGDFSIVRNSLSGGDPEVLGTLEAPWSRIEYASGYLLYVRDGALMAETLDEAGKMSGNSRRLVEGVPVSSPQRTPFSASANGVLAYELNPAGYDTVLRWFDRTGAPTGDAVSEPRRYGGFDVTSDGMRLALALEGEIRVRDLVRVSEIPRPLAGINGFPIWSMDDSTLAFYSANASASPNVFSDVVDRPSDPMQLTDDPQLLHRPSGWNADSSVVLYDVRKPDGTTDIEAVWTEDSRVESLPINSSFSEWGGVFSPTSDWMAYVSDFSGQEEVWLARFPSGEDQLQVSIDGGSEPRWNGSGSELFFISGQELMVVQVEVADGALKPGEPTRLFTLENAVGLLNPQARSTYSVTGDGERFLIGVLADTQPEPIHVIFNWPALLRD